MRSSREKIVDAAIKIAGDAGLSTANIRLVASKAGVSPSLVIRIFHSRAGLVGEMFIRGQADVTRLVRLAAEDPGDPLTRCMRIFDRLLDVDLARIELRREVMANSWSLDENLRVAAQREAEQLVPVLAEVVASLEALEGYQARLDIADCLLSIYVSVIAKRLLPGASKVDIMNDLRHRVELLLDGVKQTGA